MAVFAARTRVSLDPATGEAASAATAAAAVDEQVESLRHRWNQHGIEALISTADDRDRVVVLRYRLSVGAGHAEPNVVHQAFREDLNRVLAGLTDRAPPPDAWDLASLAAAAENPANQPPATRDYEADTGDWLS